MPASAVDYHVETVGLFQTTVEARNTMLTCRYHGQDQCLLESHGFPPRAQASGKIVACASQGGLWRSRSHGMFQMMTHVDPTVGTASMSKMNELSQYELQQVKLRALHCSRIMDNE